MTTADGRPLRTLHLSNTTDRRGAEVSMTALVAELRQRGLDSKMLALGPGTSGEQLDLESLGPGGRTPRTLLRLRRRARETDVLVAHGSSTLLAARIATFGTSTPYVYRMIGDPAVWGDVPLPTMRISRPLRHAAAVVTLWQGAATAVTRMHRVPPDRVRTIINGRSPDGFRPPTPDEKQQARADFGLEPSGSVIGYLGSLSDEKDPLRAVATAALLPDIAFAFAGAGPLLPEVRRAAAALERTAPIEILGSIDDPQRFLWAIDCLVLTSKTEGLPGVVIEAGLCGVPVVATTVGGVADLIDATTGRLVPLDAGPGAIATACIEVLADRERGGTALRDRCRASFTIDAAADQWVELLGAVATSGGPPPVPVIEPRPRLLHLTTSDMSLALLLGPQLQAFQAAGYEVIGASEPGKYLDQIQALGIRFEPVHNATRSMKPWKDVLALIELVRLFRRLRPDIVHTHNPKPGLYGRLAAKIARVPLVVNTVHGLYALPEDRWSKRWLVYALERIAASCSDAELVQSAEDIDTLQAIGIPARKIHLLGNGVDLDRFDRSRLDDASVNRFRAQLLDSELDGIPADVVVCGVVGRLVWEKGLKEVFEAAKHLRGTHPNVRIVVIGPTDPAKSDGLTDADLASISTETGVVFAGERRDMELVYASLDVFALASYREGFPRAAMEASAMGVPVVATDIRGCRQVVDDGVTGTLVPPRDGAALAAAIGRLADDPALRAEMGVASRARSLEHFDQREIIKTTLRTYQQL